MAFKISGTSCGHYIERPQLPCDERRILQWSHADRTVDAILDEIDSPVTKADHQLDIRIQSSKTGYLRHHDQFSQRTWHVNSQLSTWPFSEPANRLFTLLDLSK